MLIVETAKATKKNTKSTNLLVRLLELDLFEQRLLEFRVDDIDLRGQTCFDLVQLLVVLERESCYFVEHLLLESHD